LTVRGVSGEREIWYPAVIELENERGEEEAC